MKKVSPEIEHEILRHHFVDHWPVGTISRELCIHHDVVRRVLREREQTIQAQQVRKRKIDTYLSYVEEVLQKFPRLHSSRLYQMVCQRGYDGSLGHFRRIVRELRPRRAPEPFLRLDYPPAEQAQVDWGSFGKVSVGRAERPLCAFVMVLSWSRMVWLQFFYNMQMESFLRGHVDAFTFFSGVPRCLLYDNLKSAVIERVGRAIQFNEQLLEFASHYGFEPRAAGIRKGNEKGRVERSIRYIRTSFFAARKFRDLEDLNAQAREWSLQVSAKRPWPNDDRKKVGEQFEHEKSLLLQLPENAFEICNRVPVKVGRTPYIRFDTNDYSLPEEHVRREAMVHAEPHRIRIVVDDKVVATHARSYDKKVTITAPEHSSSLLQAKRRAKQGAGTHRLTRAAPKAALMLERAAQQGQNLGSLVSKLLELLDTYGGEALDSAIGEANSQDRVGFRPVRLLLEKEQRQNRRLPNRPIRFERTELKDITVEPANLETYDQLKGDFE